MLGFNLVGVKYRPSILDGLMRHSVSSVGLFQLCLLFLITSVKFYFSDISLVCVCVCVKRSVMGGRLFVGPV